MMCVDPRDPWATQPVRIVRITPEAPDVVTYDLQPEHAAFANAYCFLPGQFNMLYLPGVGEAAISISGCPESPGVIPHTIRQAGSVTGALAKLPIGAGIGLRGPFGSAWPIAECAGRDVILVAGGIGLAPLRPVICELLRNRQQYGQLRLLIGARAPESLLFPQEYNIWRQAGLQIDVTVDRASPDWKQHVGVVTMLLNRTPMKRPAETTLMTCGPEVMMWYTAQTALGRGLSPHHIYVSLERNMNCAIGLCGHCQFGPEFICRDGPVFRYDRVARIFRMDDL